MEKFDLEVLEESILDHMNIVRTFNRNDYTVFDPELKSIEVSIVEPERDKFKIFIEVVVTVTNTNYDEEDIKFDVYTDNLDMITAAEVLEDNFEYALISYLVSEPEYNKERNL